MKTVFLIACLLGLTLASQAEVHQRVDRSLSSSDSDEIGASQPLFTFNQILQLLMALSSGNVPAPTPAPMQVPTTASSPAPTPVPTLAPITAR